MEILRHPLPLPSSVITVGNFDGLHRGHLLILKKARDKALGLRLPLVVITFWPHPAAVLRGKAMLIQTLNQRLNHLREFARFTLLLPFEEYSQLPPMAFLRIIRANLKPRAILVGEEFRFGKGREGDAKLLRDVAGLWGFEGQALSKLQDREGKISSSRIRSLLREGKVREASLLLSRPYSVEGVRIKGQGRGKRLGFPTLNFKPLNDIVPEGVFAGLLKYRRRLIPAAVYSGRKPTFEGKEKVMEVHLLSSDEELPPGALAEILLLEKIRGEKKFQGEEDLKRAIMRDVQTIKEFFKGGKV